LEKLWLLNAADPNQCYPALYTASDETISAPSTRAIDRLAVPEFPDVVITEAVGFCKRDGTTTITLQAVSATGEDFAK
jgi:hypothetical protein